MNFLTLNTTNPYLNLAIEEFFLNNSNDDVFMLWQNEPTVVIGKNQNAFAEINLDYVKENNIKIARRITGGGAVYHDLGNINYSFITAKRSDGIDFKYYTTPILMALKSMGINATLSGRNDIMVGDKKISGNAQFSRNGRVLHHGTLLFDSNLDVLTFALKVDAEKIKSKAIKSTRSRVTNLQSNFDTHISVKEFINKIEAYILKEYSPNIIPAPDNELVRELTERNTSDSWIFPENTFVSSYNVTKKKRYPFGIVEICIQMDNLTIKDIKFFGDFFEISDISALENLIKGNNLNIIEDVISGINISDYICGMSNQEFLEQIKK